MYLCETLSWQGQTNEMVGAIPGNAVMCKQPQGRGHTRLKSLPDCPWPMTEPFKAHEFHYAKVENLPNDTQFAFEVLRGDGIQDARDGVVVNNLLAGFCHQRNTKANPWVTRFLQHVAQAKKNPAG